MASTAESENKPNEQATFCGWENDCDLHSMHAVRARSPRLGMGHGSRGTC